jgi:hypothetical protein
MSEQCACGAAVRAGTSAERATHQIEAVANSSPLAYSGVPTFCAAFYSLVRGKRRRFSATVASVRSFLSPTQPGARLAHNVGWPHRGSPGSQPRPSQALGRCSPAFATPWELHRQLGSPGPQPRPSHAPATPWPTSGPRRGNAATPGPRHPRPSHATHASAMPQPRLLGSQSASRVKQRMPRGS